MRYSFYKPCSIVLIILYSALQIVAQDTLRIPLPQAEAVFLNKNLELLAGKYNINIAEAQLIQSRLYANPNIAFSGNIYNPDNKKFFDIGNPTGQYTVDVQQLILLAGKRNKQINMAKTNIAMTRNSFYDLLRTLRYTLRSDYYSLHYLHNSIAAYQLQIGSVEKLCDLFDQLQQKGVVTLKDAVRIKSLLYSLRTEQALLRNTFNNTQAELQLLLQDNEHVYLPDEKPAAAFSVSGLPLESLIDTALHNREDLKLANNTLLYDKQNYAYQKALAVPDLTLGAQFDKRGSFVDNATFLTMAIDLPFFNRNQGNIKAADFSVQQSKLLADRQKLQVETEVRNAYSNALNTDRLLKNIDPDFNNQFEQLLQSVMINFEKKNISLLDFTDFYESYKQNVLQLNQIQNERMQALETLNFACGKIVTGN
ncbi:MAG: TolC family protein [Sphingobacteriales bacterium]|nr:TolC family protein [Sphingobacteriales bacterium]OJY85787.1 MAG: transporter [Sphingobacteriales bacterium 44-15]